jgi:hypothetical protein
MSSLRRRSRSSSVRTFPALSTSAAPAGHALSSLFDFSFLSAGLPLSIPFSEAFTAIVIWIWWVCVIAVQSESPLGQRDLITTYGLYVAAGAVAVSVALGLFVPARFNFVLLLLATAFGGYESALYLARSFPGALQVWRDLTQVGPGALGVAIDYAGCSVIAFTHVALEAYRRGWGATWRSVFWSVLVPVWPLVFYPLFLAVEMPSSHGAESDSDRGVVRRLGDWPAVLFAVEAILVLLLWAPGIVENYSTCGEKRWRPEDFKRCGLNTNATSTFTTQGIIVFTAVVFVSRYNFRIGSASGNWIWRLFIQFSISTLLFINVAAGLAAMLALTFLAPHPLPRAPQGGLLGQDVKKREREI